MDDLISRQAVTKFLNDWLSCLFENCHKQSASDLKMIIKDFKNLPSAQPKTNCSEIPNNSDVISRQAAIDKFKPWLEVKGYGWGELNMLRAVINELENMPSAQPEQRWIPITEESVIQAGYEGREVRFRIRGRLFAIRELAQ